jgi:hypothetical protein
MTHVSFVATLRHKAKQLVKVDFAPERHEPCLATERSTRRAGRTDEMDSDLYGALESADYSHIDPELNKLLS